jgi:hypothetical protein
MQGGAQGEINTLISAQYSSRYIDQALHWIARSTSSQCPQWHRCRRGECAQFMLAYLTICLRHLSAQSLYWLLLRMLHLVAEARPIRKRCESFTGMLLRVGHYIRVPGSIALKGKPKALETVASVGTSPKAELVRPRT